MKYTSAVALFLGVSAMEQKSSSAPDVFGPNGNGY